MKPKDYYETAQVCIDGHVITSGIESSPETKSNFCTKCGKKTITNCLSCNEPIRGYHHMEGIILAIDYRPPNFCHNCGKPYPWTSAKLDEAQKLSDTLENLSQIERDELKKTIDGLVRESPETNSAIEKFKELATKAGTGVIESFKRILFDIAAQSAKDAIWAEVKL